MISVSGDSCPAVRREPSPSVTVSISVLPGSDNARDVNAVDRGLLRIKKRLTPSWAQRRRDKDGVRGPLGLRPLHYSAEPLIDLIFVHGLRGGSIKTWRKGNDSRCFWPLCWLPMEHGMENVNIHTFGYDSDWASSRPSILNVHDFGQELLEEMRNAPYLRGNGEVLAFIVFLVERMWTPGLPRSSGP